MKYRDLYYQLFAAIADAVELLEQKRPERAWEVLIEAQQRAEEAVISDEEENSAKWRKSCVRFLQKC